MVVSPLSRTGANNNDHWSSLLLSQLGRVHESGHQGGENTTMGHEPPGV